MSEKKKKVIFVASTTIKHERRSGRNDAYLKWKYSCPVNRTIKTDKNVSSSQEVGWEWSALCAAVSLSLSSLSSSILIGFIRGDCYYNCHCNSGCWEQRTFEHTILLISVLKSSLWTYTLCTFGFLCISLSLFFSDFILAFFIFFSSCLCLSWSV